MNEPRADATVQIAGHTRGPWAVVEEYNGSRTIASMRDYRKRRQVGLHVTADHDWVGRSSVDVLFANAALVAAAPELLAALKGLLKDIETGVLVRDISCDERPGWTADMLAFVRRLHAAQAAILKAEGRS